MSSGSRNGGSEGPVFESYRGMIPDFDKFLEALKRPPPVHLRVNTLKAEPRDVAVSLEKRGVSVRPSLKDNRILLTARGLANPGRLPEYFLGHIHPQALTSCLAAPVLAPEEDTAVLDLCASPGGKTSHLAQLMGNTGLIVANELYSSRHRALGHTLDRLGVLNTVITGYQAQEFPLRRRFSRVLADVPCSGEGRYRSTEQRPAPRGGSRSFRAKIVETQRRIILRAFDLLEKGGMLLYGTCTYDPEENEAVVRFLLDERDARLLPIDLQVDREPGLTEWKGKTFGKELKKTARFYPHRVDSVGFFMALVGRA
ncbi:MAG: RsmB/NOP family class I SAM-dependent RNA methyltransferase [Deltaproteobacteria bacterium]|nr:RsmB/NOP family class I SAM-dependent RNA methyltransferase [Deltaproteobacteria bacterium]